MFIRLYLRLHPNKSLSPEDSSAIIHRSELRLRGVWIGQPGNTHNDLSLDVIFQLPCLLFVAAIFLHLFEILIRLFGLHLAVLSEHIR